jgi:hypothetical protein
MERPLPELEPPLEVFRWVTEYRRDPRAHVDRAARTVGTLHVGVGGGRDLLYERAVADLGLSEPLLGPLVLGHVVDDALERLEVAFFVVDALAVVLHMPQLAVPATDGVPQVETPAPGQRALRFFPDPLAVLLHDEVAEHDAPVAELLGGVAGELWGVVADELVGPAGLVEAQRH